MRRKKDTNLSHFQGKGIAVEKQIEHCPWCGSEIGHAKFIEIEAKIRADEQRKARAHELEIKKKLESDYAVRLEAEKKKAAESAKTEAEKGLKQQLAVQSKVIESTKASEKALKLKLDEFEKAKEIAVANAVQEQLLAQRTVLDRHREKELAKKDAEHKRELEKTNAKIKELGRRLEKKTASELGEVPEVDLFDALRDAFPEDKIVRVKRGTTGADIHQTVLHRGEPCGLIVFDSKNHAGWRNDFVTKLRQDQVEAKADHSILSTSVFPSGEKELCVLDGVIAVNPLRVVHVVELLRNSAITLHKQCASLEQRRTKMQQIYRLITSTEWSNKLAEAARLNQAILDLDVDEQKQHQKIWKDRGRLSTTLKNLLRNIDDDVDAIIGGEGVEEFDDEEIADGAEVPF
jgi:hypothetical protein